MVSLRLTPLVKSSNYSTKVSDMNLSISEFESLLPMQLHDYMEPLLATSNFDVTPEQYAHLKTRLTEYDQYRQVYSMLVCSRHNFADFLPILLDKLGNKEGSVVCAVINILNEIPENLIDSNLIEQLTTSTFESRWKTNIYLLQQSLKRKLSSSRTKR